MAKERKFFKSKVLQDKIIKQNKVITIGLVGTSFGSGCTHLAFMLATYFSKLRTKVCLVEWKNQQSYICIEEAYEGLKHANTTSEFQIKNMTFYKEYYDEISALKEKGFQIIIVDFGPFKADYIKTMNNFDIQLLMCHGNEWKVKELFHLFDSFDASLFYNWKIVVPFGNKEEVHDIHKKTKRKTKKLSYHKDPFLWTKELKGEVEHILEV